MPEATSPPSTNGSDALRHETVAERIVATERELLCAALDELKRRAPAEMRVATTRDPKTGAIEIIYLGVHQKADLEALRKLYALMRRNGPAAAVTF